MPERILVADCNEDSLHKLCREIEQAGFECIPALGPSSARKLFEQETHVLAILRVRLLNSKDERDESGLDLARQVAPLVPKIIYAREPTYESVRKALTPQLNGVPAAVDYVAEEEGIEALLTAIRKALAFEDIRASSIDHQDRIAPPSEIGSESISLDLKNHTIKVEGREFSLSPKQFQFLNVLFEHPNQVVSHKKLITEAFGEYYNPRSDSRRLHTFVCRLREKIEPTPSSPKYIVTLPGHGYRLNCE